MASEQTYRAYARRELETGLPGMAGQYPVAFSATDLRAVLHLPDRSLRTLGNLAALSVSTHRDAFPVTDLSRTGPKGFCKGHRTIAGTLLFHTLDRHAFSGVGSPGSRPGSVVTGRSTRVGLLPDTLPLFDIQISWINESGDLSWEALYGVTLLDMGKTVSLENLQPLEQYSYLALDYQPLVALTGPRPDTFQFSRDLSRERLPLRGGAGGRLGDLNDTLDPRLDPTLGTLA